jgi:Flp pilus assembly pilin Flp
MPRRCKQRVIYRNTQSVTFVAFPHPHKNQYYLGRGDNYMKGLLRRIWAEDEGQDIAEYAMMLAVILLIVTATVSTIGTNANSVFSTAAGQLTTA